MIDFEKNSIIQKITLEIRPCLPLGHGVFTLSPIQKGELVMEYEGELIKHKEALEREKLYSQFPDIGSYVLYVTIPCSFNLYTEQEIVFKKDKATLHVISKRREDTVNYSN